MTCVTRAPASRRGDCSDPPHSVADFTTPTLEYHREIRLTAPGRAATLTCVRSALFLLLLGIALALASGCSSMPIPPTYTQEELQQRCERGGGWWRPDNLMGGLCEQETGSFL